MLLDEPYEMTESETECFEQEFQQIENVTRHQDQEQVKQILVSNIPEYKLLTLREDYALTTKISNVIAH